ncbi:hypothetical protein LOK49_LG07G01254 [Camellia lanceoleosa]|uniref:Uncharacterized protein n=1 Tax=Camellia lanceoleosa TaxID=1840588 RepID=A0ACC0H4Q1_9ERIC|nr:hypothetical protein LOK49_LG07G01254 [Camellia lanceoleosa]
MVRWMVFLASWSPPSLLMGYDDMDTSSSNLRPWLFTGRLWCLVRISGAAAYFSSHHRWVYKFQCIIFSVSPAMGLFFHVCQSFFLRVFLWLCLNMKFWSYMGLPRYPAQQQRRPRQMKFAEVGSGSTAKKEFSQLAKRRRHHRKKITRENDFDDDEQYGENPSSLSRRASLVERKSLLPAVAASTRPGCRLR